MVGWKEGSEAQPGRFALAVGFISGPLAQLSMRAHHLEGTPSKNVDDVEEDDSMKEV